MCVFVTGITDASAMAFSRSSGPVFTIYCRIEIREFRVQFPFSQIIQHIMQCSLGWLREVVEVSIHVAQGGTILVQLIHAIRNH